jgi:ParB family chromosome partitioning protein
MSNKAQALLADLGGNMAESLGRRTGEPAAPSVAVAAATNKRFDGRTRSRDAGEMLLANVMPDPDQPRKEFTEDELLRLADSLKTKGQLQPIRVRWSEPHQKWLVVAGERRYRAATLAGFDRIQCVFVEKDGLTESEVLEEQLIENMLRESLKPIEEALAFDKLMKLNGWTGRELAHRLSLNQSAVTRALALLTLPEDVQEKVMEGTVAPSVAYEVTKLDSPDEQREVIEQVVAENLSREQAVQVVNQKRKTAARKPQGRTSSASFKSARKWTVTVSIPKKKATDEEVLAELESVVEALRAKLREGDGQAA